MREGYKIDKNNVGKLSIFFAEKSIRSCELGDPLCTTFAS